MNEKLHKPIVTLEIGEDKGLKVEVGNSWLGLYLYIEQSDAFGKVTDSVYAYRDQVKPLIGTLKAGIEGWLETDGERKVKSDFSEEATITVAPETNRDNLGLWITQVDAVGRVQEIWLPGTTSTGVLAQVAAIEAIVGIAWDRLKMAR